MRQLVIGRGPWGNNIARDLREMGHEVEQVGREGAREILSDGEGLRHAPFQGVFVATPLSTHAALAEAFLAHDCSVWLEKPAFRTVKEAKKVQELAHLHYYRRLFVDYTYLHSWGFVQLLASMQHDVPIHIDMVLGRRREQRADCSLLWDWAAHFFAIYFALAPWVEDVEVKKCKVDDMPHLYSVHPIGRGPTAGLELTLDSETPRREMSITGAYANYRWCDTDERPWVAVDEADCRPSVYTYQPEGCPSPLKAALTYFLLRPTPTALRTNLPLTLKVTKALMQLGNSQP